MYVLYVCKVQKGKFNVSILLLFFFIFLCSTYTILIIDIFSLLILLVMRSQHTSNVQRDMRKCDLNVSGEYAGTTVLKNPCTQPRTTCRPVDLQLTAVTPTQLQKASY